MLQGHRQQAELGGFRTFTISNGQARSDHIRISDGLHLVYVVAFDTRVKQFVDRVEKRHYLKKKKRKKNDIIARITLNAYIYHSVHFAVHFANGKMKLGDMYIKSQISNQISKEFKQIARTLIEPNTRITTSK